MNKTFTTFYIVRHGETDWNAEGKLQGITDIPLNAKGELQAMETGKKLQGIHFDLAFSSDLLRAKRTAEIIALEHNLEVELTTLLRERAFGTLEGEKYEAIKAYEDFFHTLTDELKWKHRYVPDMESDEELVIRLTRFLRETALTHPDKTILVGTHGAIMRIFLVRLGFLPYEGSWGAVHNGAYIQLISDGIDFEVQKTDGIAMPESEEL